MPTPLVISNAAVLKLRWSGPSRTWLNVIGLIGNPALPTIDQALANAMHAGIAGAAGFQSLISLLASTVIFEGITLKNISVANQAEFVSVGTPLGGAGALEVLPLSNAAVVTVRTALSGKSFRGRTYFSGFDEGQNDATGRQAAAVNVAVVAAMTSIDSIAAGHTMRLAVLSRPQAARTIPARDIFFRPGTATVVSSFVARNSKWESQRRRTGRE